MLPSWDTHFDSQFLISRRFDFHHTFTDYSWGEAAPIGIKILYTKIFPLARILETCVLSLVTDVKEQTGANLSVTPGLWRRADTTWCNKATDPGSRGQTHHVMSSRLATTFPQCWWPLPCPLSTSGNWPVCLPHFSKKICNFVTIFVTSQTHFTCVGSLWYGFELVTLLQIWFCFDCKVGWNCNIVTTSKEPHLCQCAKPWWPPGTEYVRGFSQVPRDQSHHVADQNDGLHPRDFEATWTDVIFVLRVIFTSRDCCISWSDLSSTEWHAAVDLRDVMDMIILWPFHLPDCLIVQLFRPQLSLTSQI